MSASLALKAFTAAFSIVYILGFISGKSPYKYYPLIRRFSIEALPRAAGPAMNWYGWITAGLGAGLAAALIALAVPRTWADRVWPGFIWLVPAAVVVVMLQYEMHWFTDQ